VDALQRVHITRQLRGCRDDETGGHRIHGAEL
jgi:hypothetical protein